MAARLGGVGGRRVAMLAAVAAVGLAGACARSSRKPRPEPEPVLLEIQNHAFADMDVYMVPSPSGAGPVRMATVNGGGKTTLHIRAQMLQPGNVLQVLLHPIGSRVQWYSPPLSVSPGERVALEINSDASGSLSRTVIYPLPDPDGGQPPVR